MTFAKPEWLALLLAIPLLAVVAWLTWRQRGQRWKKIIAHRLQHRLASSRSPKRHFLGLLAGLLGLAGVIIAFAQPESGEELIEVENEGRNLLLCIDISRSMLAEDLKPNRLQASRAAALEILERFPNDRVGVLLFAGEPLVQAPLTLDHQFIEQTLAQLNPNDIPYGGSNLTSAISAGNKLLRESGQSSNIMVVFSDGEESTQGLEEAAEQAAEDGVFIYSLGMGTREGTFIPDPRQRDQKFRDRRGNHVFTRLDEEALQTLASTTQGSYAQGIGASFLAELDAALARMDQFQESEGGNHRIAKPAYQWFLLGGIVLLMLSVVLHNFPVRTAAAVLAFFFSIPQVEAGLISDGREALAQGEFMEAHRFFSEAAAKSSDSRAAQLQLAAGAAAHQGENWNLAAEAFSSALQSDDPQLQQQAHFALATTLFHLGASPEAEADKKLEAWQGAVKHYEEALTIQPGDQKSLDNLAQVKKLLEELKSQQEEQEQKNSEDGEDSENDQSEDQNDDQKDQENQENEESQDDQSEQQDSENQGDEQGENSEQDNSESGQEGEQDDQQNQEQPDQGENSENSENQQDQSESDSEQNESQQSQANQEEARDNESPEERARRLLQKYSDFGGKAPRRMRRPMNRPAQDW